MNKLLYERLTKIQGKRLQECREKKKLSRPQLAKKISFSENTIKKWETGERPNGLKDNIPVLANTLEVYEGYLSGDDNFQCEDYSEYLEYKQLDFADINKYMQILFPALLISASTDSNLIEYAATLKEDIQTKKRFTVEEMEIFYKSILEKLKEIIIEAFNDYSEKDFSVKEGTSDSNMKGGDA